MYVGDGWVRLNKGEVGFALPAGTKESKRLVQIHMRLFRKNLIQKDKNYIYLYSINLARFIDSLGFGRGAKNKIVPPWVFTLTSDEKEAFVNGLMQSDGYSVGRSQRYVSASMDLLKTLKQLLQTMGYRVGKIHTQTKKKGTFCVYRSLLEDSTYGYICFSRKIKSNILKYLSQTKQRDLFADNEFFSTERIMSIKIIKHEPTLDLRVDGEHNFVADGIVVHNTGVQRSGSTEKYAFTTTTPVGKKIRGKQEFKKEMPFIIAAHDHKAYVATANIAEVQDFIQKVRKALKHDGPSYIQVLTSCTPGWKIPTNISIDVLRKAVQTRFNVLFEIENGILTLNKRVDNPLQLKEYLMLQGRYKHLTEQEIKELEWHINERYERIAKLDSLKLKVW